MICQTELHSLWGGEAGGGGGMKSIETGSSQEERSDFKRSKQQTEQT